LSLAAITTRISRHAVHPLLSVALMLESLCRWPAIR